MSERELQAAITDGVRKLHGNRALIYHVHDSRGDDWASDSGFPDLVIVIPVDLISEPPCHSSAKVFFIEVKAQRGKVTPEQQAWHDALKMAGQEAYILRPSDFPKAWEALK